MLESPSLSFTKFLVRLIQQSKSIRKISQIHTQILTNPILAESDFDFLISRLLFFVAIPDSGCLNYASRIFNCVHTRNLPLYNIMIRAYASDKTKLERSHSSLALYKEMLVDGIRPNALTFPFLLKECGKRLDLDSGCCVYGHSIKFGIDDDVFVRNSMISLYSLCGVVGSARKVFDEMSERDVVSWNSMIIGFLRSGELGEAMDLFRRMDCRNIITWNSMITGFVQGGQAKKALELFHEMQHCKIRPDKVTIASVLSAITYLGAIDHGKWVHSYLKRTGLESDTVLETALVDMYGKCGSLVRAHEVFTKMSKKDTQAWTAMISAFALHGHVQEAFDMFEEMKSEGIQPNQVTFIGLLSACAHSGMVEKGRECFRTMRSKFMIEPRVHHYACMVDILSRAGLVDEANELIRGMPMAPDVYVWGALLGGCQMQGNLELGEEVAKRLISLEPRNHAFYMTLRDIYRRAGKFDDVKRVRALMKENGVRKEVPGCSMIEVEGVVYEFSAGGSPDVMIEVLDEILDNLNHELKIIGSVS
ncbi:Pentatricopeptide repeat-containing protein At5g66520 [Linum perenne]